MAAPLVTLRAAVAADRVPLWRWRNDPETRRASFDQAEIPLEEHSRWFEESLARPDRRIYIVQAAGVDAGMIRLDVSDSEATVNINLAPEWRGRGIAAEALRSVCREAFGLLGLGRLTARVKADNRASRRAFESVGFTLLAEGDPLVLARMARLRLVAAIQARVGSSRLPGKVLREAGGRPLLGWIIARLSHAREVDAIVVSTSRAPADDVVETFARSAGVACFRGSEDDLLDRFAETARHFDADALVRITADCPLVDPAIVDRLARAFREAEGRVEYVSNVYPSTFPHGLDVEVLSRELLGKLDREVEDSFDREWFSAFIREHPERFSMLNVATPVDLHELRWTVDYPEDLEFVHRVFSALGPTGERAGMTDVLALLERHPDWRDLNRHREDSTIIRGIRSVTYHRLLAERARAVGSRE